MDFKEKKITILLAVLLFTFSSIVLLRANYSAATFPLGLIVILSIANSLGLAASAGVGVAEKVCGFIMLTPSAFMQAMSAYVAQNHGAGRDDPEGFASRSPSLLPLAL